MTTGTATGQFVQVGPFRAHYLRVGEGPAVILLHGLGGSCQWWQPNLASLGQHHAVYAVDIPGHGVTDKPHVHYNLPLGRSFLLDFMAVTGIERATLVGHSTGGLIALDFALAHPDSVNRLVLVDSAGLGREMALFLRLMTLPAIGELLSWPHRPFLTAFLSQLFHDRSFITDELVDQVHQERNAPGFRHALLHILRYGAGLRGLKDHVLLRERLPLVKAPLLVLWGEQDRILPATHARAVTRLLPSARVHIFPTCGHAPNWEKAEDFNRIVVGFLNGYEG